MRKTLIIGITALSLTLGGLGIAYASGKVGHGPMMDGRHLDRIGNHLDLTEAQQAQLDELTAGQFTEMRQGMRSMYNLREILHKLDPTAADYDQQVDKLADEIGDKAGNMVRMRANQHQAFNAILTAEQREEFAQMSDKMQERGKHRFGGHGEKWGKGCRD